MTCAVEIGCGYAPGLFRGYEAIFDARLPGSERVRVLLQFLGDQRQVPLILHADQVEKGRPRAG